MKCDYCGKEFLTENAVRCHAWHKHKDIMLEQKAKQKVNLDGIILETTNAELDIARRQHDGTCDICGKKETTNTHPGHKDIPNRLSVDHDHQTMKFRGFLCTQCNRNLGWFEKYRNSIAEYLHDSKIKK